MAQSYSDEAVRLAQVYAAAADLRQQYAAHLGQGDVIVGPDQLARHAALCHAERDAYQAMMDARIGRR